MVRARIRAGHSTGPGETSPWPPNPLALRGHLILFCVLRKQVRLSKGRKPVPSAVIIDAQSVKTSGNVGESS
ncbi:hypothetical protein GCM10027161_66900 [Microbispora hainanensis]